MQLTFLGVRGSTPSPGEAMNGYGGNTSCVCVMPDDGPGIILDLGTGVRRLDRGPLKGAALLTHLHFDHVQGLPFCAGLLHPESELDIYGPPQDGQTLADAFDAFVRPPVFPVTLEQIPARLKFIETGVDQFELAPGVKVRAAVVPHPGPTYGYRIDADGHSVVYVPDHQQPVAPGAPPSPDVVELARGADLLIHDAQYTHEEFARRSTWGHCTVDYAVDVAVAAGVGHLALFHHDPNHVDGFVDSLVKGGVARADGRVAVFGAREASTVDLAELTGRPSTADMAEAAAPEARQELGWLA